MEIKDIKQRSCGYKAKVVLLTPEERKRINAHPPQPRSTKQYVMGDFADLPIWWDWTSFHHFIDRVLEKGEGYVDPVRYYPNGEMDIYINAHPFNDQHKPVEIMAYIAVRLATRSEWRPGL